MEFQKTTEEQKYLANLFEKREAVVFCGAGISLDQPAGLPGWSQLRDYTLEAIASKNSLLCQYLPILKSIPIFGDTNTKSIPPELVASKIVENCTGYFECFRALAEGEPNANHRYIAKMVKAGHLKYIITTNFDLFLERALSDEGIPFQVYRTKQEFAAFSEDIFPTHLLKLHGCISKPETITATVGQQLKGLSSEKATILELLLTRYCFMFFGYSGYDLQFNLDYLRIVTTCPNAKGFIWNFLNQKSINPYVAELANLYKDRARIIYGKFPALFENFIDPKDQIKRTQYTPEQEKAWQEHKNESLKTSLKNWAEQYLSAENAYNIFAMLLQHIGEIKGSTQCYQQVLELASPSPNKLLQAQALNNLASTYRDSGELQQALERLQQALKICQQEGLDIQVPDVALFSTLLSAIHNNMGDVYHSLGRYQNAIESYQKALEISSQTADKKAQAFILNNIGTVLKELGQYREALSHYERAAEIAQEIGEQEVIFGSLHNIGIIYQAMGKMDNALNCYQEAQKNAQIICDNLLLARALNSKGRVLELQSKYEEALSTYKQAEAVACHFGYKRELAQCLINLGHLHECLTEYDLALPYYEKAEQILRQIDAKSLFAEVLCHLGSVHFAKNHYSKALDYLISSKEIAEKECYKKILTRCLYNIGCVYNSLRKNSEALKYLKFAQKIAQDIGDREELSKIKPALEAVGDKMPIIRTTNKIGRNDLCFCGSGKKYKKCCGQKGE
ncbi:MAG: hypothetical protein LiPW30_699 [Parcubacteria group bacterium LiPW_30]|nr:MAG: hypothetical protein LiPW30_699 [Parcubacteria group bacterium LiPW_30]